MSSPAVPNPPKDNAPAKQALQKIFHNEAHASPSPSPSPNPSNPTTPSTPTHTTPSASKPPLQTPSRLPQPQHQPSLAHSASAPSPAPSPSPLSFSDSHAIKKPPVIDDENLSPRKQPPPQPHMQQIPLEPLSPPPVLATLNNSGSIPVPSPSAKRDRPQTQPLPPLKPLQSSASNGALAGAHAQVERELEENLKLTRQIELMQSQSHLAECILRDTLQAIDEGESDVLTIKMYIITAIASLKAEDPKRISFGKMDGL